MKNRNFQSILGLILLLAVLAFLTDGTFLTPRNLTNLTRQVAINGILAIGMTYVILIGGIDLSVGSVVALSGVVVGLLQVNLNLGQWAPPFDWVGTLLTIAVAVGVGISCGFFNAWMITRHRIAPFIITLGMMVIARGLALIFAKGAAIAPLGENFNLLGQGYLPPFYSASLMIGILFLCLLNYFFIEKKSKVDHSGILISVAMVGVGFWTFQGYRGIPIPVLLFGILSFVGIFVLQRMRVGRFVLAMGGNPEAAWLSGISIQKIALSIYLCMGACSGLSGAVLAARLNGALPTAGELFELDAIAAVVIGGTSLRGGIGTIRGSIFGAFLIGVLNNGMSLLDVTEFYQKVIKGLIIVTAVWMDMRQSEGPKQGQAVSNPLPLRP